MNKLYLIFGAILLIGIVSSATYYVTDPTSCPSSDGTNFPGQNCAPQDICGDVSGIAQCYDTSTISPPGSASSTTGTGGTDYTCTGTACSGGFITNCYATTNCLTALIDRNATCYNKHVQTTATAGAFAVSTCSATCTTNYFQCDGSTTDADGCEINTGSSCGAGTGTVASNQCYSASAGNCTSSTRLDCDNDDSDAVPATCNGANGCEITIGGACSVGGVSGTYGSSCSGGAGVCNVADQDIATTGDLVSWSGTDSMLWLKQFGAGPVFNFTDSNNISFLQNTSGLFYNDIALGGGMTWAEATNGTLLQVTDEANLNVNKSDFWDAYGTANSSQFQQQTGGVLGLNVTWLNTFVVTVSNIVGLVGNWTADKVNYYTKTEVTTNITSSNTTMATYVVALNTSQVTWANSKFYYAEANLTGVLNDNYIANASYANLTRADFTTGLIKLTAGNCDVTTSGSICRNSTGTYIVG